ncbi:histidine phosphatase superfamily [Xylariales sp. PMI_506]|nr:histidine phosphatase superfamily [Xylariales sp. PMI_506]
MPAHSVLKFVSATLAAAGTTSAQIGAVLAPAYDIAEPTSGVGSLLPLQYAGANSPYFPGPNVYDIPYTVPEGCTVQQASYVVRHGSRFPDSGSYGSWVALEEKIQAAIQSEGFSASGSLSFIPNWHNPSLTYEPLQISQQSMTGFKELHDLGYQLRTRYPGFYQDGTPFLVWANQYDATLNESRILQTAKAFLEGYLYVFADTYGTIVSVNSTGSASAVGDSLGPSDACPAYVNNAVNNVTDFDNTWMPAAIDRMNAMVTGNLTFDETDLTFFPYICAYETQILGYLSPWCGVFNDTELYNYQYSQDLSYYFGVGPGSSGPTNKLFLPWADEMMALLMDGPGSAGQLGVAANGSTYQLPNLIMSFLNDNQIAELTSILGIFDNLDMPIDHFPGAHPYDVSHFITMRGTVAFEVLNCIPSAPKPSTTASFSSSIGPFGSGSTSSASVTGSSALYTVTGTSSSSPTSAPNGTYSASNAQSGGSSATDSVTVAVVTVTTTVNDCGPSSTSTPQVTPKRRFKRGTASNETYIRIVLNDVVYPVTACQDGPGYSCLLSDYAATIHAKNEAAGNFIDYCNVTTAAGHETTVVNGGSFYTNLTLDYLTLLKPGSLQNAGTV